MSNEGWSVVVSPVKEAISEAVEEEDVDVFAVSSESSSELYDSPETLLLLCEGGFGGEGRVRCLVGFKPVLIWELLFKYSEGIFKGLMLLACRRVL